MRTNFCVLFFVKKRKNALSGPLAIYLRITYDGKRAETATGHKCLAEKWNARTGRATGTTETIRSFNANLAQLEMKIMQIHDRMLRDEEMVSAERIKDELMGKGSTENKKKMIVEIFKDHNQKVAMLVHKEFAPATLTRYRTTLKHLQGFIKERYKANDYPINRIGHQFIVDFEFYLRTTRNCANNSAVKYVKNFKKLIRICLANGWMEKDPFINYRSKIKNVERCFLSEEELLKISKKEFSIERLAAVRDIFLFSCYTGLAYADVYKLCRSEVVIGQDKNLWIITKRKKTDTRTSVPLLPRAENLLRKYIDDPKGDLDKVFPVATNQRMNAYLKEIAILCGIDKQLTYHVARHTFATTVTLSNGVPIETVSKMLGHTNIKTTQHYAKVLDTKIGMDMAMIRDKFADY
jgi:site-specific recombinase XerD